MGTIFTKSVDGPGCRLPFVRPGLCHHQCGGPSPTAQRLSVKSRDILASEVSELVEKTAQLRLGKRKSAFPAFPQLCGC